MLFFTNEVIRGLLANRLETAELGADGSRGVGAGPGSRAGEFIEGLTTPDAEQSVIDDVFCIRNRPLVPNSIATLWLIYDVKSGRLLEVPGVTEAGKFG